MRTTACSSVCTIGVSDVGVTDSSLLVRSSMFGNLEGGGTTRFDGGTGADEDEWDGGIHDGVMVESIIDGTAADGTIFAGDSVTRCFGPPPCCAAATVAPLLDPDDASLDNAVGDVAVMMRRGEVILGDFTPDFVPPGVGPYGSGLNRPAGERTLFAPPPPPTNECRPTFVGAVNDAEELVVRR